MTHVTPERFALEVPGLAEHLATVRIFAASLARRLGFGEDVIADLKLALSEAGTLALATGSEALRVEARAVDGGIDFVVDLTTGSPPDVDDDIGGVDLIKALFTDAAVGPGNITIPVRGPGR